MNYIVNFNNTVIIILQKHFLIYFIIMYGIHIIIFRFSSCFHPLNAPVKSESIKKNTFFKHFDEVNVCYYNAGVFPHTLCSQRMVTYKDADVHTQNPGEIQ